ncbi:MAG: hypothetical protein CMN85_10680 [Spongiibacteraceae bacterium]|nr:hypothetical protein [Spongiibacteraceae bacterium]|tara:strand:+ start:29511 stop:30398 length:888 start_codon:yes stop_codon:yes gene_type:complete
MRLVVPIAIDENNLTATNVAENDAPAYSGATTYDTDDQVIYEHRVYESLEDSNTGNQPDENPTKWNDLGPTNRYKAFDQAVASQTENSGTVEFTVTPGEVNNAVSLLNLSGNTAQVIVTDPTDGEVYNTTKPLVDNTEIDDWFAYFFDDISSLSDVVFIDLPQYRDADIEIIIDADAGTAKVGTVIVGKQREVGESLFGSSVFIDDYSRKERDAFGNFTVVERGFSKRGNFAVKVDTAKVSGTQRALSNVRSIPTLYVGDAARAETIIYGFYKNFEIVLSGPEKSDCTLEVEGMT